ncbi:MAG: DUF6624 domain-containing protein [Fulvivirga sp.]|nr:DUF6624 domain-containing protein [Fulvivirga sp.]
MKSQIVFIIAVVFLSGCNQKTTQRDLEPSSDLKAIGSLLDSIYIEDQKYRDEIEEISERYGWESEEMQKHWAKITKTDSNNLVVVKQILDTHGWLSSEQIGSTANSTLFLVIQHSNQETQEKYLPMMRQAVKDNKANSQSLALLEDRIALGKGELQVYGSQIGKDSDTGEMFVLPLIEPELVNERRASVGLGPIEEYISHWNIEWDIEEYKKKLPERIEKLRENSK